MSSRPKLRKVRRPGKTRAVPSPSPIAVAVAAHRQGRIAEAVRLYRQILDEDPDQVDALHFLGVALHQSGDSQSALVHLDRALTLLPDHPDARNNRGNVRKQLGRLDEAEADYRHALALAPGDPRTLNNLGTVLRARGDLEGAEARFRRAIAIRADHAAAWQNLGNTLKALGRLDEALDALQEAMRLAPQSADSYRHLGALLHAVGRADESKEVYQRWLARFPDDPRAQHFVAASAGGTAPDRTSDAFVRAEFDDFAPDFDATLARLDYRAPTLVADEVARLYPAASGALDVLDAGCGTGLCGPHLRPRARQLVGVDLSAGMVDVARQRGGYDDLVVAELSGYLSARQSAWDLIVSADTLVYFGDLGDVTAAAARALRPGGSLVFTVEVAAPAEAPHGFRLNPNGRYSHTEAYLRRVLGDAGFGDLCVAAVTLRKEAAQWVDGFLVSGRRPAPIRG